MRRALLLVLVLALAAGCLRQSDGPTEPTGATPPASTTPGPQEALRFEGERALALVEEQVRRPDGTTRYRIPGTEGNNETALLITQRLREGGWNVTWHHFNATYGCRVVPMHNVVADRPGTSGRLVVFAAHYDTRPVADKDRDPSKRDQPVPGANDGASGVAVLLELARVMPPTADGVRLVFFDGEDGGLYRGAQCTDWILGSRAYAARLSPEELRSIRAFVLVDMVGDAHLELPREGYSRTGPGRGLLDDVYAVAKRLAYPQFQDDNGPSILDDHVPFVEAGVPAIDLIHLVDSPATFPSWHHTLEDDLEAVSAASLEAVGRTLEAWVRDAGNP